MDNELERIFAYLSARHFHASREWVEGCVGYFREQHEGSSYSFSQMQEFVTQQWELADLREISPGCLPPNLAMQKKTVLSGKYSLQVESMVDIAKSCYSQIQTIRNVPLENVKATEQQKESWEPSAKRVLQLNLCDGIQEIRAIEYKPLRVLDQHIVPGFKILIIGPVDCRRGIVLLSEHNLQLIGGEVDSLLIPNALENVLARALNLDENPDPYNCQNDVPTQQIPTTTRTDQSADSRRIETDFLDDDDDIFAREVDKQLNELEERQKAANSSRNDNTVTGTIQNEVDSFEEAYQREIEMMDMNDDDLESIEQQPLFSIPNKSNVSHKQSISMERHESSKKSIAMETELLEDDDIFLHVSDADLELTPELNKSTEFQDQHTKDIKHETIAYKNNQAEVASLFDDADSEGGWLVAPGRIQATPGPRGPATSSTNRPSKTWKDSGRSQKSLKTVTNEPEKSSAQPKISTFFNTATTLKRKQVPEVPKNDFCNPGNSTHIPKVNETVRTSVLENRGQLDDTFNSVDDIFANVTDSLMMSNYSHRRTEPTASTSHTPTDDCVLTDSKPFVYIKQLEDMKINTQATYTIKAFVLTLTSFLKTRADEWYLTAKLCDGSATLDVEFSCDLLDNLIGYSANEAKVMRKGGHKNPLLKERLTKALQKAQQTLVELNALFTLSFNSESGVPSVIEITEVTEEHLKMLKARVKNAHSTKNS